MNEKMGGELVGLKAVCNNAVHTVVRYHPNGYYTLERDSDSEEFLVERSEFILADDAPHIEADPVPYFSEGDRLIWHHVDSDEIVRSAEDYLVSSGEWVRVLTPRGAEEAHFDNLEPFQLPHLTNEQRLAVIEDYFQDFINHFIVKDNGEGNRLGLSINYEGRPESGTEASLGFTVQLGYKDAVKGGDFYMPYEEILRRREADRRLSIRKLPKP